MPFEYRPLRYFLFCLLPMAAISGWFVLHSWRGELILKSSFTGLVCLPFVILYLMWQYLQRFSPRPADILVTTVITVLLASAAAFFVYFLLRDRIIRLPRVVSVPVILGLLIWYALSNAYDVKATLYGPGRHLARFNRELPTLVGADAIISGAYGPALTIDNSLPGVYNYFGASRTTGAFFEAYPVTHVLATSIGLRQLQQHTPRLESAELTAQFYIRDITIRLYRVAGDDTPNYAWSPYERAWEHLRRNQPDSAMMIAESQNWLNGQCENCVSLGVKALFNAGQTDRAAQVAKGFANRFPDDYSIQLTAAGLFGEMYTINGDPEALRLTDTYLKRAKSLNPHVSLMVSDLARSAPNSGGAQW